jgi:hypothetical protein
MIEISFSTEIEIINIIEFLLNNPNIQSIFFLPIKSSFISIKSSNTFICKRKKSDYEFYDEKFNFFSYLLFLFNIFIYVGKDI